jgi:hypothetical protein
MPLLPVRGRRILVRKPQSIHRRFIYGGYRPGPMAITHKAMNAEPTTQFLMRLPKTHRELLDELVAENPQQSRAGIIRAALEEYVDRHRTTRPGAA